ncbi:MAG: hypothetical protein KJ630_12175 [Proteobacteria bacterium]|nr:hypothetical protein [Pseudomonadota bacterium]
MSISPANRYHPFLTIFLVMVMGIFCHHEAHATNSLVTGKYISYSGTDIVLHLTIQNPAPANLIVEQYLSPENVIIDTAPQAKKIDSAQGNIKWLFKNTRNGILSLSIQLDSPLVDDISAIVRYRTPQGGAFTELRITP